MTASQEAVTPVKTGVRRAGNLTEDLDSGPFDKLRVPSLSRDFRRNDGKSHSSAFYETVKK